MGARAASWRPALASSVTLAAVAAAALVAPVAGWSLSTTWGPAPSPTACCWTSRTRPVPRSALLMRDPRDASKKAKASAKTKALAERVAPPRVSSNVPGVSVRAQIRYAQQVKAAKAAAAGAGSTPGSFRKYRRSKQDAVESKDNRGTNEPCEAADLSKVFKNLVLVDGYNVIGADPELSAMRDGLVPGCGMSHARDNLIKNAMQLAAMRRWRVELVFDAYQSENPVSRQEESPDLTVVYTGSEECADAYMARVSYEESQAGREVLAFTSDNVIRNAIGSHGGLAMHSSRLLLEMTTAAKEAEHVATNFMVPNTINSDGSRNRKKKQFRNSLDLSDEMVERMERAMIANTALAVQQNVEVQQAGGGQKQQGATGNPPKQRWEAGTITRTHQDGSCDVRFGSGRVATHVAPARIRVAVDALGTGAVAASDGAKSGGNGKNKAKPKRPSRRDRPPPLQL